MCTEAGLTAPLSTPLLVSRLQVSDGCACTVNSRSSQNLCRTSCGLLELCSLHQSNSPPSLGWILSIVPRSCTSGPAPGLRGHHLPSYFTCLLHASRKQSSSSPEGLCTSWSLYLGFLKIFYFRPECIWVYGFSGGSDGKESASGSGWRKQRQPTPVFLPGKLPDGGDWQVTIHGVAESDTNEQLTLESIWFPWWLSW